MAEITRQDLITDDALVAFKLLAADINNVVPALDQVLAKSKEYAATSQGNATSVTAQRTAVQGLTQEQKLLIQVQDQIAKEVAKNSDEYKKQAAILKDLKEETKIKNQLGQKEALTVTAQNSSIKELGAALNANRAAYAALRSEEERTSAQGKQLLQVIQQQDAQFKALRSSIGQNQDNVGNYEGALKSLKAELKAAKDAMVGIAQTLGEDSDEFKEAAAKAGKLKNELDDIQGSTKAVSGKPIENLGGSFGLLTDKVKALDFKGATSAMNGLVQSTKNLTFKEATEGIGTFGKSLGSLGKAILTNPIFLIASAVALIGVAIYSLRDKLQPLEVAFQAVGKAVDWVVQKFKDFSDWLGISSFAVDDHAKAVTDAMEKEIESVQKRYDREIKIQESAAQSTIELEKNKQQEILNLATQAYQALEAKKNAHNGKLNEEDQKMMDKYVDIIADANTELQVIENKAHQEALKKIEEQAKERKKAADQALADLRKRIELELQYQIALEQKDREKIARERQQLLDTVDRIQKEIDMTIEKSDIQKQLEAEYQSQVEEGGSAYERVKENEITLDKQIASLKKKQLQDEITALDKLSQIYGQFASGVTTLFGNLTQQRLNDIDAEETALKNKANKDILLAGGNAEAKAKIQADLDLKLAALDKKKREEQNKQAKLQRDADVIQAVIMGIKATLKGLEEGGPLLAAVYASLAAVQVAAIMSKPLPKYAEGTDYHPGGKAIVGEQGHELVEMPSGRLGLTPGKATLVDLPQGSKVFTNDDTMRMLAISALKLSDFSPVSRGNSSEIQMLTEVKGLRQDMRRNRSSSVDYVKTMSGFYEVRKESETFTKRIRAASMGDWTR